MYLNKTLASACFIFFLLILSSVSAFGVTVTNTNDSGPGSLRDAVANTPPGGIVDFDPSLAGSTITLLSEIIITKDLTIQGLGADELTISGGGATRLFIVVSPATFFGLSDIRITGGNGNGLSPGNGGAILFSLTGRIELDRCVFEGNQVEFTTALGGALLIIAPNSEVIINDSTFSNNSLTDDGPIGGALVFIGEGTNFEINRSTFNNNSAVGAQVLGGAIGIIGNFDFDTITITNSTFSENSVECSDSPCSGGAVSLIGDSVMNFNNNTFSDNTAVCSAPPCDVIGETVGVIGDAPVTFYSNIIANGPDRANCAIIGAAVFSSLGFNITSDATCISGSVTGDQPNTNPGLDPAGLRNNGGPTETIAIFDTSAAFEAGDLACPPPLTDQRGIPRPQGTVCDVGAFELLLRVSNIPTLSEWGMIAAAAGFLLLGAGYAMKRRKLSA